MACAPLPGEPRFAATGTPWDWAGELAAACCGLRWDPAGPPIPPEALGGTRFNDEAGRQPYHDREDRVAPTSPFAGTLTQADLLTRLARLNRTLGWDHTTVVQLPTSALGTTGGRGALWSALFAGAHARLLDAPPPSPRRWFRRHPASPAWDPSPFEGLLEERPDLP